MMAARISAPSTALLAEISLAMKTTMKTTISAEKRVLPSTKRLAEQKLRQTLSTALQLLKNCTVTSLLIGNDTIRRDVRNELTSRYSNAVTGHIVILAGLVVPRGSVAEGHTHLLTSRIRNRDLVPT